MTKITEKMTEHETGDGFTLVTNSRYQAFATAERMAFAGYSVQLSGVKGGEWKVVATESMRTLRVTLAMQAFVLSGSYNPNSQKRTM